MSLLHNFLKFIDSLISNDRVIRSPKRKMKPEVSFENGSGVNFDTSRKRLWTLEYSDGGNVELQYKFSKLIGNLKEKGALYRVHNMCIQVP